MGMKMVIRNTPSMQAASTQAYQGYFSPASPEGCILLLCWDNRINDPTLSYPHGIGGHTVDVIRVVVVARAACVDIAKIASGGRGIRTHLKKQIFLNPAVWYPPFG